MALDFLKTLKGSLSRSMHYDTSLLLGNYLTNVLRSGGGLVSKEVSISWVLSTKGKRLNFVNRALAAGIISGSSSHTSEGSDPIYATFSDEFLAKMYADQPEPEWALGDALDSYNNGTDYHRGDIFSQAEGVRGPEGNPYKGQAVPRKTCSYLTGSEMSLAQKLYAVTYPEYFTTKSRLSEEVGKFTYYIPTKLLNKVAEVRFKELVKLFLNYTPNFIMEELYNMEPVDVATDFCVEMSPNTFLWFEGEEYENFLARAKKINRAAQKVKQQIYLCDLISEEQGIGGFASRLSTLEAKFLNWLSKKAPVFMHTTDPLLAEIIRIYLKGI